VEVQGEKPQKKKERYVRPEQQENKDVKRGKRGKEKILTKLSSHESSSGLGGSRLKGKGLKGKGGIRRGRLTQKVQESQGEKEKERKEGKRGGTPPLGQTFKGKGRRCRTEKKRGECSRSLKTPEKRKNTIEWGSDLPKTTAHQAEPHLGKVGGGEGGGESRDHSLGERETTKKEKEVVVESISGKQSLRLAAPDTAEGKSGSRRSSTGES